MTTWGSPMGKSPTPMDTQNSRKVAAVSSTVTRTSQGRQTKDTPPSRTPGDTVTGGLPRFTSVSFMRS